MNAAFASRWSLDPALRYLNHGAFGACPKEVLAAQDRYREQLEREPTRFFTRELEPMLAAVRTRLGEFIGAPAADLALITNATSGVNTVLRSLRFAPGDELLTTDHAYNACRNALEFVAERSGARVVVARIGLPVESAQAVVAAVLAQVTPKTRLALIDHVTSPTGIVFPVQRLVKALADRGVDTLVDGAHAPGMLPLEVKALGAAYYTGNCHKWICAPKGAAFLYVREDLQREIRPLVISHGARSARKDRARFRLEFDWTGTDDPSAHLAIPDALTAMEAMLPGGWPAVMAANRAQAVAARTLLVKELGTAPLCPEEMLGALAAVALPHTPHEDPWGAAEALQLRLLNAHQIEVPIVPWTPWLVRVSAQLYNSAEDYRALGAALGKPGGLA